MKIILTRPYRTQKVMRNKYNSTTRDEMRKLMVGGGILERKVIEKEIYISKDIYVDIILEREVIVEYLL